MRTTTLMLFLLLVGCNAAPFESGWTSGEESETDTYGQGGQGLGQRCDPEKICGEGLSCSEIDRLCHIDCSSGEPCPSGQSCSGADGACWPKGSQGTTGVAGPCGASFDCADGLVCAADATCQEAGSAGTTPAGEACDEASDCQLYLSCLDSTCQGFLPPYWNGAECGQDAPDSEPFRLFFEVERSSGEFYRLPYPNDIRRSGTKIDLSEHAVPRVEFPGVGVPATEFVDMAENDAGGFGTNSFVFFRFNRNGDAASMSHDHFRIVNIDPTSESYGDKASAEWRASSAQGRYICRNWLALGPTLGRPLLPGTIYAAIVTTSVTDPRGAPATQDADFSAVIAPQPPVDDPALVQAWNTYAPLRAYLEEQGIEPSTIAGAAMFTTADPQRHIPAVREAVRREPEPAVKALSVKGYSGYTLYTGLVTTPFFQNGQRPFLHSQDGGAVSFDAAGRPMVVEEEEVRFALSLPSRARPATGWPVVLFAHGTGGSELSFVETGLAARLSARGVAIIGIEQVMHGSRRGLSQDKSNLEAYAPERLVNNLLSPRAARDNHLQAAADHFQLVRLVERFADLTGRSEVVFNPDKLMYFGHSQGSIGPMLFAVHEPLVKLIVLSGAGGNIVESLLGKKSPFDLSLLTQLALLDPTVDRYNPLLNLVQAAFDQVDPVNFARTALRQDYHELGYPKRHVFMSYGLGDTYTPERSQTALAKALGVRQWALPGHELEYVTAVEELPYTSSSTTAVVVQYEPDSDYDGHFVIFRNAEAQTQLDGFLETFVANGVPTLVTVD